MTQWFLHDLHVFAVGMQQSRVVPSERVPADTLRDTESLGRRLDVVRLRRLCLDVANFRPSHEAVPRSGGPITSDFQPGTCDRHDSATGFPVRSHHLSRLRAGTAVRDELLHRGMFMHNYSHSTSLL